MKEGGSSMSKIAIEISELRENDGDEAVKDLKEFLEDKTGAKVEVTSREVILQSEEKTKIPARSHVRVLLKKFLHKAELKDVFRVIVGKENAFVIKLKKAAIEEE
jgi:hypothetical protein